MMVWKCPPLHLPNWSNHWKWKQEMNSNDLADRLEEFYSGTHIQKAAETLRQQADEIAELKNARDYWCLQYKDVFNKLESKQNG
jgi:hypothetical protein